MVAVKVSKPDGTSGKGKIVAMTGASDSYSWMSSPFPFPSHPGIYIANGNDSPLPRDCHGILEQAALDRCHGNNEAYVHGLNRLAKCSSENEQLSCRKKCREEVLKQADFIADYGVVLEGLRRGQR